VGRGMLTISSRKGFLRGQRNRPPVVICPVNAPSMPKSSDSIRVPESHHSPRRTNASCFGHLGDGSPEARFLASARLALDNNREGESATA